MRLYTDAPEQIEKLNMPVTQIDYDDKHYIIIDNDYERVQEGWKCRGWVELKAGGIGLGPVVEASAARKERAKEMVKEKAATAIKSGALQYPSAKDDNADA